MQKRSVAVFKAIQPLIGSVIGVGIFGIPYVFAQAGWGVAVTHLVVLAIANGLLLLMYADVIKNTNGHARIAGLVKRYLGNAWSHVATILMFASTWGAMVAYVIIGGSFLFALFHPLIGGGLVLYQCFFFAIASFLVLGGLGFVTHLETAFTLTLVLMLSLIIVGAAPHVQLENLTYVHPDQWFLPFGVILFAFGGLAAIPESAHVLGRFKSSSLTRVIVLGMGIVSVIYLVFGTVVAGVSGDATTEEAVVGLGRAVGDWALVLGSVIGIFAVLTSFLVLGLSVMDTLIYDYRRRYLLSWSIAVFVPLFIFLLGARDFIGVIGFTGSLISSLIGLLVIRVYLKAKKDVCLPKRCLTIPNWAVALCGVVFFCGVLFTFLQVL